MEGCLEIRIETAVGGQAWIETWTMIGYDRIESWMEGLVSRVEARGQQFHDRGKKGSR